MIKKDINIFLEGSDSDRAHLFGKWAFYFLLVAAVGFSIAYFVSSEVGYWVCALAVLSSGICVILAMVFGSSKEST